DSSSILCTRCLSQIHRLSNLPVDGFYQYIRSRARAGADISCDLPRINAFLEVVPENLTRYDRTTAELERLLSGLQKHQSDGYRQKCLHESSHSIVRTGTVTIYHCHLSTWALSST
ncbi:hypothetical protein BT96DRAFT_1017326, partial [Gymnopus androsaceus JB14]